MHTYIFKYVIITGNDIHWNYFPFVKILITVNSPIYEEQGSLILINYTKRKHDYAYSTITNLVSCLDFPIYYNPNQWNGFLFHYGLCQ